MTLPLYVRGGTVLPLGACDSRTDYDYLQDVEFRVFGLKDGSTYTLSIPGEEEGVSVGYTFENRDGQILVTTRSVQPFRVV